MPKQSIEALTIAETPTATTTDLARALDLGGRDFELLTLILKHSAVSSRILGRIFQTIADQLEDAPSSRKENEWLVTAATTLAGHPLAEPAMVGSLARVGLPQIRAAAASNPNCPDDSLLTLTEDVDPVVRAAVSANPRLHGALSRISGYDELQFAKDPKAAASDLAKLSAHAHPQIRHALVANPTTPASALPGLFACRPEDSNAQTYERRQLLLRHPNMTDAIATGILESDHPGSTKVLSNPGLSPAFLASKAANPAADAWSKEEVASNPVCPEKTLVALCREALRDLAKLNTAAVPDASDDEALAEFTREACRIFDLLTAMAKNRRTPAVYLMKIRMTLLRTDSGRPGHGEPIAELQSVLDTNHPVRGLRFLGQGLLASVIP